MGDSKKTWQHINHLLYNRVGNNNSTNIQLLNDNKLVSDKTEICDIFNRFFSSVASNIQIDLEKEFNFRQREYTNHFNNIDSMFLRPVTNLEVESIIARLSNNVSCGINGVSVRMVKNCTNLVPIFTYYVNRSFETGIFPDSLKVARVTPIYKSNSKHDASNYRPISVLNVEIEMKCCFLRGVYMID